MNRMVLFSSTSSQCFVIKHLESTNIVDGAWEIHRTGVGNETCFASDGGTELWVNGEMYARAQGDPGITFAKAGQLVTINLPENLRELSKART